MNLENICNIRNAFMCMCMYNASFPQKDLKEVYNESVISIYNFTSEMWLPIG